VSSPDPAATLALSGYSVNACCCLPLRSRPWLVGWWRLRRRPTARRPSRRLRQSRQHEQGEREPSARQGATTMARRSGLVHRESLGGHVGRAGAATGRQPAVNIGHLPYINPQVSDGLERAGRAAGGPKVPYNDEVVLPRSARNGRIDPKQVGHRMDVVLRIPLAKSRLEPVALAEKGRVDVGGSHHRREEFIDVLEH
jgi:hypothetical protein